MPFTESPYDGASLYYRQYVPQTSAPSFRGSTSTDTPKPTLVFTAAWPFSRKMYDHLITTLVETYRYPCILPDRRGFGHSEWSGPAAFHKHAIDYNVFAQDLHHIIDKCDGVKEHGFVAIGTSMGCGEIIHTLFNDSTGTLMSLCKGITFICPSLPLPMWTQRKPSGPPRSFWDDVLGSLREDPDEGLSKTLPVIFGPYLESMPSHQKARYEDMLATADRVAVERAVQIFLDLDFTDELEAFGKRCSIPVLILHGSEDYANPADINPPLIQSLLPNTELKVYAGAGHCEYKLQVHYYSSSRCYSNLPNS